MSRNSRERCLSLPASLHRASLWSITAAAELLPRSVDEQRCSDEFGRREAEWERRNAKDAERKRKESERESAARRVGLRCECGGYGARVGRRVVEELMRAVTQQRHISSPTTPPVDTRAPDGPKRRREGKRRERGMRMQERERKRIERRSSEERERRERSGNEHVTRSGIEC